MSDVLARICADKREHIAACKQARPLAAVEAEARAADPVRGFERRLREQVAAGRYGLICEIKKASPSKGLIRADFDPPTLAEAYETGGATCLSVLTDRPYFQGDDAFLSAARSACSLPVLRKDFMLDPYQVVEARAIGADCILVIMAALSDAQAGELVDAAATWGLDVLVEVHDAAELERAARLGAGMIGVNNRNLKTLTVDLAVSEELAGAMPDGVLPVCESGLNTTGDLARMSQAGYGCFLIGESLMRQADVATATRLLSDARPSGNIARDTARIA